ncbi:hypothetical protein [Streptomyces sp. 7-21]|uniref:hypothetical protein n=1 Tax=Streptomyces sp. 7-21 TaxID=2802283 RepID=UPI00191F9EC7|nr:hypothetical protein [Streptomyces sp. 7-21]MBL1066977.1 hypothetical protein [Streptomyces sp. 7-21]
MTSAIPLSTGIDPTPSRPRPRELSRHRVSGGLVVWSRCSCGRLRMAYAPDDPDPAGERPLTAGGGTPGCPDCDPGRA